MISRRGVALLAAAGIGMVTTSGCQLDAELFADCDRARTDGCLGGVSAGRVHSCGVRANGGAMCWGDNSFQQRSPDDRDGPYRQVSAGWYHSCAIHEDGSAQCWGAGESVATCTGVGPFDCGQAVDHAGPFVSVSAGAYHTCALRVDGQIECWGAGNAALDLSTCGSTGTQCGQAVSQGGRFDQVAVGEKFSCGRREDGRIDCWGYLGIPGPLPFDDTVFVDLVAGHTFACGLREDGVPNCWGIPINGVDLVASIPVGVTFSRLFSGSAAATVCGITSVGSSLCWGQGIAAATRCGTGEWACGQGLPTPGVLFARLAVGGFHGCGIPREGGPPLCWGGGLPTGGTCTPDATATRGYECGQAVVPGEF